MTGKDQKAEPEKLPPVHNGDERPPSWVIWSAASYAIVMVLIGLPLWWKTTAVQREFLPYDAMLGSKDFLDKNFRIKLELNMHDIFLPSNDTKLPNRFPGYKINYAFKTSSPDEIEAIYKTEDLSEVDAKFCGRPQQSGSINVYFVGRSELFKKYGKRIVLGNCHSAYYVSNSNKLDVSLLRDLFKILLPSSQQLQARGSTVTTKEKLQLPLSLGYEVLLSLLIPQPELQNFAWDVQGSKFKDYLDIALGKLSAFAEIKVRSQYLYYVNLNVQPRFSKDQGIFQIPYDQLPLVINPVEYKLPSFVSANAALNFLIYTAPCDQHPLHLLNADNTLIANNAFLVPQWGGIQIYNGGCGKIQENATAGPQIPEEISLKQVLSVIASQFRDLVGISSSTSTKDILPLQKSAFRDWEIDIIGRKRLFNLLYTSANTLHSLGQLLDQITNIVVTEEVGLEVEKSVRAISSAVEASNEGRLIEALSHAKTAFKSSEIAFHHPTNLAQLYFPDDQKYAIYIPLFLPVGIPVLLSLQTIFSLLSFRSRPKISDS